MKKNQEPEPEPEPEPLEKKSGARAGKKFAGSPALQFMYVSIILPDSRVLSSLDDDA